MPTDLGEHLRAIWARKYHVLLLSLLIAGGVYLLSARQEEVYEASLRLRLDPGESAAGERVSETETAFLASSYAELADGDTVLAPAAERLDESVGAVRRSTSVDASGTPGFLDVSATAGSAERASELATAVGDALIDAIEGRQQAAVDAAIEPIEQELDDLAREMNALAIDAPERGLLQARYDALLEALVTRQSRAVDQLEVISPARAGDSPVSPRPARDAALAFLVALVVNSELAVLLSALGDRLSRDNLAEDISATTGLPLLASVPLGGPSETVEAFRELRTNLQFLAGSRRIHTVAIVGDEPGIGKTLTALNLARAIASAGTTVVVVDADLRRPSIHERMGVDRAPGVTNLLRYNRQDAVRTAPPAEPSALRVLTSGSPITDPSDLLTAGLPRLVDATAPAEMVLFDTPPLRLFADGLAIASQCDATVLVVDVRRAKRRAVKSSIDRLQQVGAHVVGVVANRTDDVPERKYYDVAAKEARDARTASGTRR